MEEKNNNLLNINEITEDQLPVVISNQFQTIKEIDNKIKETELKIQIAKDNADKMSKAKSLHLKESINTTQNSIKSVVEAQAILAQTQKLLFELQQKMSEGMRFLLLLGAENIAMNKRVVKELESKLKRASEEGLSTTTKQELINVIRLLREQESMFNKQEEISQTVSKNSELISKHDKDILDINEVDKLQDLKDIEHDKLLDKNNEINRQQDESINNLNKTDLRHNKDIKKTNIIAVIGLIIASISLILSITNLLIK